MQVFGLPLVEKHEGSKSKKENISRRCQNTVRRGQTRHLIKRKIFEDGRAGMIKLKVLKQQGVSSTSPWATRRCYNSGMDHGFLQAWGTLNKTLPDMTMTQDQSDANKKMVDTC